MNATTITSSAPPANAADLVSPSHRRTTYYWKCDRPAAFHGTTGRTDAGTLQSALKQALQEKFPSARLSLEPGHGQGNHITFIATVDEARRFVRVEDGPEKDNYLIVESRVLHEVRTLGLPAPRVHAVDASRESVPFAWQMLDLVDAPDLNHFQKKGELDLPRMAGEIGAAIARWQCAEPAGYGPFDPAQVMETNTLCGFHASYEDYFFLHFERHLRYLTHQQLLSSREAAEIESEVLLHRPLLALNQGCLVHKDLALWNILGTPEGVAAFIDWDDAISGDAMDDLSLLACFHDGPVLARALEGYQMLRPLPTEHRRRFWLHLLRNMIVKAVIRVGAGYFEKSDGFFLIGSGSSGQNLQTFTTQRIASALQGLRGDLPVASL
ncbi:aminoglycoside phosphotransferase family protein [Verrucomicrobium spinosum]|uniref:aminoglycoside phosphotransferase family protein n=1 Tax=Verrucomicrobium spinosum TaxID=2736 RepID=UPI00017446D5|nr:aminoglycoside phosphotransferase family protein [Verrucomicrobium spinosum]